MPDSILPTLYKLSETGAVIVWNIRASVLLNSTPAGVDEVGVIVTSWGQEGGAVQETRDVVSKGKSAGKANATTPYQQACKEAQSKWEKQQKAKKYVLTREAALAGERSEMVEGGVDPMLAYPREKKPKALKFPCDVQPKLDGHRCIAMVRYGTATLWSRTRKPIKSVPHIVAALEKAFPTGEVTLDGELYNHDFKDDFEALTSILRKDEPAPGHEVIQYHIYDVVVEGKEWAQRHEFLDRATGGFQHPLVRVQTEKAIDEDTLSERFQDYLEQGYEGLMARNLDGLYVGKRSADLLKVKTMTDSEFEVIAVEEGRGKLAGHAIFVFKTNGGMTFRAKMVGDQAKLKEYWDHPEKAIGKLVTVKYQNLSADGIPRFPVALRFRKDV